LVAIINQQTQTRNEKMSSYATQAANDFSQHAMQQMIDHCSSIIRHFPECEQKTGKNMQAFEAMKDAMERILALQSKE
jgi:hypothetical protein